jgi:hypothetical protein
VRIQLFSGFVALAVTVLLSACGSDRISEGQKSFSNTDYQSGLIKCDLDSPDVIYHEVEIDEIANASEQSIDFRNPNTVVTGHYNTRGGHTVTLSAIENHGGIHGKGRITGPVYIDVKFDVDCVTKVGNRATVGGKITSIELGDNPFELDVDIGWILYLAVEDNGEGANAASDRYHTEIYLGEPGFGSFCDFLAPDGPFWPEDEWYAVVGQGDQIQVK